MRNNQPVAFTAAGWSVTPQCLTTVLRTALELPYLYRPLRRRAKSRERVKTSEESASMHQNLGGAEVHDAVSEGGGRDNGEESEPLTNGREASIMRAGMWTKARGLLGGCWRLEVLFVVLGLLMICFLASIDMAVRTMDLGLFTHDEGVNIAKLEQFLTAHETDYFTLYTANISSELLFIEFPLEVVAGSTAVSFILGASFARGSFDDVDTFSLLHYPAEDTDETLFTFRLTEDMGGIDLLREELTLRTSDEETLVSLAESAPPQWVATLPVLDLKRRKGIKEPFILASAEVLLMNGFFVTGIREGTFTGMRVKLSETRSYPKNAGVTVEYQLAVPEDAWRNYRWV